MDAILEGHKLEFTAPSGYKYTIREQNGADDDILSNPVEAQQLMNISRFIAGIVVSTDFMGKTNGRLTPEEVHNLMPALDRYCILMQSRIFSIGKELDFEHDWGKNKGGIVNYSQDLEEFLFDYSKMPTNEELEAKPNAIPYYPQQKVTKDITFTIGSGKELMFDLLTAQGESYVVNLPLEKGTKNQNLIARNLRVKVDGKWEKVTSFHIFSVKDMIEIRSNVLGLDPIFNGITTIENPNVPGMSEQISVVAIKGFFYPGEI